MSFASILQPMGDLKISKDVKKPNMIEYSFEYDLLSLKDRCMMVEVTNHSQPFPYDKANVNIFFPYKFGPGFAQHWIQRFLIGDMGVLMASNEEIKIEYSRRENYPIILSITNFMKENLFALPDDIKNKLIELNEQTKKE